MVKSFRHKGLKELFETGRSRHVNKVFHGRCIRRLDALNNAKNLQDLSIPGFGTHPLRSTNRHAISVSGPWRITFRWDNGDAYDLDFEQYH